ncbi:MAG: OmpW family outer membrane protein, partial [Pseudomonadota bacterium]
DFTYMVSNNFGIELLAALPFKHDIDGRIGSDTVELASIKHLPPTLSAVYHFNTAGRWQPYLGAGLNWTIIFDEDEKDALGDASLKLSNSVGFAAVAGLDIAVTERFYLNGNIRWMNIESDVKLDGVEVTTAKIDPLIYAINVGWRLGGG